MSHMLGSFNGLYKFQALELSSHPDLMPDEGVPQQAPWAPADKGLHAFVL